MLRPLMRLTALYAVPGVDLTRIHGLGPSLALKLAGEWGTNLSAWPSSKHFTSWPCLAPGNKISGARCCLHEPGAREAVRRLRRGLRRQLPAGPGRRPAPSIDACPELGKPKQSPHPPAKSPSCSTTAYAMAWITAIPAPLTTRSATAGKSCPICSSGRRPLVTSCKRPA